MYTVAYVLYISLCFPYCFNVLGLSCSIDKLSLCANKKIYNHNNNKDTNAKNYNIPHNNDTKKKQQTMCNNEPSQVLLMNLQ